jgi:hypothetical protein
VDFLGSDALVRPAIRLVGCALDLLWIPGNAKAYLQSPLKSNYYENIAALLGRRMS